MKKVYLGLTAIAMQFSAMAATWTLNGTNYTVDVTTTKTLTTGVTYHAAHVYTSSHNMRIFYTITDLTNEDIAVRAVPGGSKLTNTATVSTMAGRITDATPIVGTNGGFFSSETPGGLTVVDGEARKGFSGDGYYAITFDENNVPTTGYLSKITCWCSAVNGIEGWTDFAAINTTSTAASNAGVGEQIIFYTPESNSSTSGTSGMGGYAVQLTPVNGSKLTPGKYLKYKVASAPSSGNVTIPSNGIVMFGKGTQNGAYVKGLTVGTEITVYMNANIKDNAGNITTPVASQALGGSLMILDGGTRISSYANDLGAISSNQPRTAVGYNADKTKLIMCVVDGRSSGWSTGCTGKVLGDIMKNLGCSDAMNFDGGGSSQFWITGSGLVNDASTNNSGGGIRAVADGLFVVKLPSATLTTSSASLSLSTTDNAPVTKTFTVTGANLRGDISLALSGTNANQFSISSTSISQSAASATITVTYKPTAIGTHSANITISSKGASSKTVTLTGSNTETPEEPGTSDTPVEITGYKLTQDWAHTSGHLTANTNTRWATGFGGKIYINDHANSLLYYWDANGLTNTGITSAGGTAITSDDAGNIIIPTSMFTAGCTALKVLPAGGTSFQDLTLTMPDGVSANQMQYLGKIVGNIMNGEGGIMFMFPKDATSVAKFYIQYGEQKAQRGIPVGITADGQSFAMPLEDNFGDNFAVRVRGNKHFYHNDGTSFVAYPDNGINTTQGGTFFTLNGTLYNVQPIGTAYVDGFQIVDITNNKVVATHDAQFTTQATPSGTPNPNCITAEVVDTYTVKLYQYVPGQLAAQYTFSLVTSGIEDVMLGNEAKMSVTLNGNTLNIAGIDAVSTSLYSINGSMVAYDTDNTIDASGLNGVYIVVAKTADGTPYTAKVIVK